MFPTILTLLDEIVSGAIVVQRLTTLLQPAMIVNPMLTTMAALASILSLVLLSGVAVGSVVVLLGALLALYFIVTEVLGISVEVTIPQA